MKKGYFPLILVSVVISISVIIAGVVIIDQAPEKTYSDIHVTVFPPDIGVGKIVVIIDGLTVFDKEYNRNETSAIPIPDIDGNVYSVLSENITITAEETFLNTSYTMTYNLDNGIYFYIERVGIENITIRQTTEPMIFE